MNEKLPLTPMTTTATTIMEPQALPLPPVDTEGASTYHITAVQVPLEFGGTLKNNKGSKNNSNQQSPQKKSRSTISGSGAGGGAGNNNSDNRSGSYCTCFGGCGYAQRNRIAMPFWPAVLANLGICALLVGYIFIGSFIFLTIENSNEQVVSMDASIAQHSAQLPQIIQEHQQQQQQERLHRQPQATFGSNLQKQEDNSIIVNHTAMHMHHRNARSTNGSDGSGSNRHLAKSAAPEVSTHINGMYDDNSGHGEDDVGGVVVKRHHSVVASGSSSGISGAAVGAKPSTLEDYGVQALPLADTVVVNNEVAAARVDEDYIGDDASVYDAAAASSLSLEDVERRRTVENIWDITVSLNILYKENWTRLAALEIAKFQDQLVKRLVMDLTLSTANGATQSTSATVAHGRNGKQNQATTVFGNFERQRYWQSENTQQQNNQRQHHWWSSNQRIKNRGHRGRLKSEQFEWNFATAFLYSMTVITTVGYGTITARTTLGRMVTIGYATLGIPLTLIYLSSIGSVLAKLLRYCCSMNGAVHRRGICCCCCLRRPPSTHRQESSGSSTIFNRHPQVADCKTELKLKHFQQPQQQQPLPYCYVRPPAATAQEMEMQQHIGSSGGGGNGGGVVAIGSTFDNLSVGTSATETSRQHATAAAAILSWSLAGPAGFCVLFLIAYVTFGAVVIALLEDWPLIDGIYFCFMSLSTIGFCDLLPGLNADGSYDSRRRSSTTTSPMSTANVAIWFCAVYILSGLTLTSMCVNLLQDEIASRMRVVVKFEKVHELQEEQRESGYYSARS